MRQRWARLSKRTFFADERVEVVCVQRILLVEDGADFILVVQKTLSTFFDLSVAKTYDEARMQLNQQEFDLLLFDINIPGKSGLELFAELSTFKHNASTPVVFLTGKSDISTKLTAFSMGAEDYLVKPFDPLELKARVEAKLKRARALKVVGETISKGDMQILVSLQRVKLLEGSAQEEVDLTSTEFKILAHLARQEGKTFSREELKTSVWGQTTHVTDRTVDVHVSTLRRKLKHKSVYVESVRGVGYRFRVPARKAA